MMFYQCVIDSSCFKSDSLLARPKSILGQPPRCAAISTMRRVLQEGHIRTLYRSRIHRDPIGMAMRPLPRREANQKSGAICNAYFVPWPKMA